MERLRTLLYFAMVTFSQTGMYILPGLLLGFWAPESELGVYYMALRFVGPVQVAWMLIGQVLHPVVAELVSKGELQRLERVYARSTMLAMGLALAVTLVMVAGIYILLPFLKDPRYYASIPVFAIMAAGGLWSVAMGLPNMVLLVAHHEPLLARLGIGIALWQIIVAFLLIPHWGAIGAAIAYILGAPLMRTIEQFILARRLGIRTDLLHALRYWLRPKATRA